MERLGKYTILERIGKGAMGVVYRAWDDSLGEIAIKVMSADVGGDDIARERFVREARVAAALDHPNIIDMHGMGEHEGRPYIVMELLAGENLKSVIARRAELPLERRLEIMKQVAGALAYAHRAGVAHRDIKPENVFVTDGGDIRILDFGVARLQDSTMTATGAVIGTPSYMSPEQVAGGKVDSRSDIFAAGTVFYELLIGVRAFAGRVDDVFEKIVHLPAAPIHRVDDRLPVELSSIIEKAMAKEPDRRYQAMDQMLAHLETFEGSLERLRRETRREVTDALAAIGELPATTTAAIGCSNLDDLPQGYLELTSILRTLEGDRDHIDVLIDELQWVTEVSAGSLDGYGDDTLRAMANRVDDIRDMWPAEPGAAELSRRILQKLRARVHPAALDLVGAAEASRSSEFSLGG